jgi:hypothetical protein
MSGRSSTTKGSRRTVSQHLRREVRRVLGLIDRIGIDIEPRKDVPHCKSQTRPVSPASVDEVPQIRRHGKVADTVVG